MPRTAHVLALYTNTIGEARIPTNELMLTIDPPSPAIIGGATARIPIHADLVDVDDPPVQSLVGVDQEPGIKMPALFTSPSNRSNAARV